MTPDQIRWLTWGAIQHRPSGAPRWDEPGTHKAITDHCGSWGFALATEHVLAHARDPKARTPFAIKGNPPHTSPERMTARPPKPHEACRDCGRHVDGCLCDSPATRPIPKPDPEQVTARVLELKRNVLPLRPARATDPTGDAS